MSNGAPPARAIVASVAERCLLAPVVMPRGQVGSRGHEVEKKVSV